MQVPPARAAAIHAPFALSLSKGLMVGRVNVDCTPPARSVAALVPVTFFASPKKVTKERRPQAIRCFPAVLASGGRRRNRPTRGTRYARPRQWTHAAPLGPPAAALLGANPWGPANRSLIASRWSIGTRMQASGLRYYMNFLRLNAFTCSPFSSNHSPFVANGLNRRCQYASMPSGSSV